jgi:hypothetical protein
MSTAISGYLRGRFRLNVTSGLEAPGFVYDKARMPGEEIDRGTPISEGAFWDGSNKAFHDKFHIPEVSGKLEYSWKRSNITPGESFLIAGYGDNDDLELSGIIADASGISWSPIIEGGVFFDLDTALYLYSQDCSEEIVNISGTNRGYVTTYLPAEYKPMVLATFFVDDWGRARVYENFKQKHSFTSWNGQETLSPTPGTDPVVYESRYTSIRWQNVVSGTTYPTNFEFLLDRWAPGVVVNKLITSGVHARLRRVPWSQTNIQLPLVPVTSLTSGVFYVYEDPVRAVNGIAITTIQSGISNVLVTGSGYVRVSGSWDNASGILPAVPTASGVFPASGMILIDDGDERQEIVTYLSFSGIFFSGLTRSSTTVGNSGIIHRDGAQIRLIVSGVTAVANYISGVNMTTGDYLVNYRVSGVSQTLDTLTGLLTVPALSGIHRVEYDVNYKRGILLCYEPSGITEFIYRADEININPLAHGTDQGIVWASMFPLHPAKIKLETSRNKNDDGTIGPVYAGNDFLVVNAKVLNEKGAPVPQEVVTLVLENPINAGYVNAESPGLELITRVSDGTGVARFVYTPPDTIQGLGYFVSSGSLVGSGLVLTSDIPIEEVWDATAGYKTLLFSVYNDDLYTTYSEVSGAFDFTADGRFELVTVISGGTSGVYSIWTAIEPVALLDSNNLVVTASGSRVSQIVYAPNSIPTGTDIGSYFVSVERRISVGAMIPGSNIASESLEVIVGIPRFMTGEFLFGAIDAPDTSAFDSLAYLTVNPFEHRTPTDSRHDPRNLGNVFRIQGSTNSFLRFKFYLGIDYDALADSTDGRTEIKKIHTFRNRFILET